MPAAAPIAVVNRLLRTVYRSLPMYLADARPWTPREQTPLGDAIGRLAADRRAFAERLHQAVLDLGGHADFGAFPGWYTGIHDLAIDYLAGSVDQQLADDILAIQQCIADLPEGSPERDLAREILSNTQRHRETLNDLREKLSSVQRAGGAPAGG